MGAERDSWIADVVDQWLFTSSSPLPTTLLVPLENPHLHDPASWAHALGPALEHNGLISLHRPGPQLLGVARPVLGASAAAMLAHAAAQRGVSRIVGVGFCGATQPDLQTGDVVVARDAVGGDGVSDQYLDAAEREHRGELPVVAGSPTLVDTLAGLGRTGRVHTVGAVHLETRELIEHCHRSGILGLDMETAALYAVGQALGMATAACLLVTDRPVLELPARGPDLSTAHRHLLSALLAALTPRSAM